MPFLTCFKDQHSRAKTLFNRTLSYKAQELIEKAIKNESLDDFANLDKTQSILKNIFKPLQFEIINYPNIELRLNLFINQLIGNWQGNIVALNADSPSLMVSSIPTVSLEKYLEKNAKRIRALLAEHMSKDLPEDKQLDSSALRL